MVKLTGSLPSCDSASREEFVLWISPIIAFFFTFVVSDEAMLWELPRFLTLGFCVTADAKIFFDVDDDILLVLLVLVRVLLELVSIAITSDAVVSVDCELDDIIIYERNIVETLIIK